MAKIKNKQKYPIQFPVNPKTYFIGSDPSGKAVTVEASSLLGQFFDLTLLGQECLEYPTTTVEDCETGEQVQLPLQLVQVLLVMEKCICENKNAIDDIKDTLLTIKDRVENVICYNNNEKGFVIRFFDVDDSEITSLRTFKDIQGVTINEPNNWTYGECVENIPPVANAGEDMTIGHPTREVTLNGTASTDSDGTIISYLWTVQGNHGSFNDNTLSTPIFTGLQNGQNIFTLTVTDNSGATDTDEVIINSECVNPSLIVFSGKQHDMYSLDPTPAGIQWGLNGNKFYSLGNNTKKLYEFEVSSPYEINTVINSSSLDLSSFTNPTSFVFNKLFNRIFIVDSNYQGSTNKSIIYQYNLSSGSSITTAIQNSNVLDYNNDNMTAIRGIYITSNGGKIFAVGHGNSTDKYVSVYTLPNANELNGATYSSFVDLGNHNNSILGADAIKVVGKNLYILDQSSDSFYNFTLNTLEDVTTIVGSQNLTIHNQSGVQSIQFTTFPVGFDVNDSSDIFYITNNLKTESLIYQFEFMCELPLV